jgi:NitT/TauT family transport system permease protein
MHLVLALAGAAALGYLALRAVGLLATLPAAEWATVGVGLLATAGRVAIALALAVAWTVPAAVAIGATRQRAAAWQPIVQVVASIPATALFPVLLLVLLRLTGGLNFAAILLMLMGTQWYLLFNAIAGVAATPQDLKYTTAMLGLGRADRWRAFVLPALFPFLVTGAIAASGGAWNASIVAEYVTFGGETYSAIGVGAVISAATASGNYPLLLAATLALVATVVLINRLVWRRLYRLAEDRYRME